MGRRFFLEWSWATAPLPIPGIVSPPWPAPGSAQSPKAPDTWRWLLSGNDPMTRTHGNSAFPERQDHLIHNRSGPVGPPPKLIPPLRPAATKLPVPHERFHHSPAHPDPGSARRHRNLPPSASTRPCCCGPTGRRTPTDAPIRAGEASPLRGRDRRRGERRLESSSPPLARPRR